MKKILLMLCILLFPAISFAGGVPETYWFCYQVGTLAKGKDKPIGVMVISNIHSDRYHNKYDDREYQFYELIQKESKGKFVGQFEARCVSFDDAKKAMKYRTKSIMRAKHSNYELWQLEFAYDPNKNKNKTQDKLSY